MIHAYDKIYLNNAKTNLARMLDFAVYDLNYNLSEFFTLFISSKVAEAFENGDVSILAGRSGIELAYMVLDSSNISYKQVSPKFTLNRSEEYWLGYVLAHYQWTTNLSFKEIIKIITINEIIQLYNPYHEMDIQHFIDKMNELYNATIPMTKLKILRMNLGLSQSNLAKESGISVRTIQHYEQRQKDINKAQAITLLALSKILFCDIEDLIENP